MLTITIFNMFMNISGQLQANFLSFLEIANFAFFPVCRKWDIAVLSDWLKIPVCTKVELCHIITAHVESQIM